ncbi:hypothetical protein [Salininema proteolyticum]|uniref:Uncharacterized protein n=1 Tax=Salininema proteolyticum TaxID=1607685 RepID=A0ABV8U2V8_9ACTN
MTDRYDSSESEDHDEFDVPTIFRTEEAETSSGVAIYLGDQRVVEVDEDAIDEFCRKTGRSVDEFVEVVNELATGIAYEGPRFDENGNGLLGQTVTYQGDDPELGSFDDAMDLRTTYFDDLYQPRTQELDEIRHYGTEAANAAAEARDRYVETDEAISADFSKLFNEFD